jgi:hypothetical protein
MARKKKMASTRIVWLVVLGLLIALGVWAWLHRTQFHPAPTMTRTELALPPQTPAGAQEQGSNAQVAGKLQIRQAPRDVQLGVSSPDAVILLRKVEMYQWQELCEAQAAAGKACRYETAWSAQHIDSGKFRSPVGHENSAAPFADARFVAADVRLGELSIDPELVPAQHPAIDYPVRPDALPPNLAATFSLVAGVLYAGGDAAHPRPGTLRVSYRVIPGGEISLSGVRRGSKLEAH